jgi:hydrogenase assembly chaperone HypC/HupF
MSDEISLFLPPVDDEAPVCTPGPDGRCALCADEGLPGQVLALRADGLALVGLEAGEQEVALDLVAEAQVGDWVLVHLGFAIARLEGEP